MASTVASFLSSPMSALSFNRGDHDDPEVKEEGTLKRTPSVIVRPELTIETQSRASKSSWDGEEDKLPDEEQEVDEEEREQDSEDDEEMAGSETDTSAGDDLDPVSVLKDEGLRKKCLKYINWVWGRASAEPVTAPILNLDETHQITTEPHKGAKYSPTFSEIKEEDELEVARKKLDSRLKSSDVGATSKANETKKRKTDTIQSGSRRSKRISNNQG